MKSKKKIKNKTKKSNMSTSAVTATKFNETCWNKIQENLMGELMR